MDLQHIHISAKHRLLDLKLDEVWQYRELIFLFCRRGFVTLYKQTILGPVWLFISPLVTAGMNTIVFGNIAKLGTDGIPQMLFYLSGNAIWSYFASCLGGNAGTFTGNAGLFGKVYFPRLTVPLSNILSDCIRFGIKMILVVVLLIYYCANGMMQVHPLRWLLLPLILLHLGLMGMGCGILASSVTTKYRDLSVLVSFGLGIWMYATPVVYPLSELSDGPIRKLILMNPVTPPVELFRYAVLGVGTIEPVAMTVSLAFSTVILFTGIIVFNRVERTFMDTV
jgi:lipopolysaccharide transport system permease protein